MEVPKTRVSFSFTPIAPGFASLVKPKEWPSRAREKAAIVIRTCATRRTLLLTSLVVADFRALLLETIGWVEFQTAENTLSPRRKRWEIEIGKVRDI